MPCCTSDRGQHRFHRIAVRLCGLIALAVLVLCSRAYADDRDNEALRVSQAAIGRPVSDWTFTDHAGRAVRLSDWRGKPLVVSFIYTGCFQVCPATTQFLKRATNAARDALGTDSFRVVSIGFNQPFDSPDALASFARQQGVDLAHWEFLAPREADVESMLGEFGMSITRTAAGFDHLIQATIVDAGGTIQAQVYGDAFELPMFIGPLKQVLAGEAARTVSLDNLWRKVKLYCTVYDPASGKYRLNYSLFFEIFAGLTTLGALLWFLGRESRRHLRDRRTSSGAS
jgi:protein SCO1/2